MSNKFDKSKILQYNDTGLSPPGVGRYKKERKER